jgi:hypothetical protein
VYSSTMRLSSWTGLHRDVRNSTYRKGIVADSLVTNIYTHIIITTIPYTIQYSISSWVKEFEFLNSLSNLAILESRDLGEDKFVDILLMPEQLSEKGLEGTWRKRIGTKCIGTKRIRTKHIGTKRIGTKHIRKKRIGTKCIGPKCIGDKTSATQHIGDKTYRRQNISATKHTGDKMHRWTKRIGDKTYRLIKNSNK